MIKTEPQKFVIESNEFVNSSSFYFNNKNLLGNTLVCNDVETPIAESLKSLEEAQQKLLYIDNILKHALCKANVFKENMYALEVARNACNKGEYVEVVFKFKNTFTSNLTYNFDIVYLDFAGDETVINDIEIFLIPPRDMFYDLLMWYIGGKGEYSQKIKITLEGISFADIEKNMQEHFSEYVTSNKT